MAQWDHGGGFSVDGSVRIEAADRAGRERLLRYCARPPFALDRLRELDPERLLYEGTKPGPGGNGPLLLTPLELLDRLAALVPPPRIHRHRYFGVRSRPTHLCARQSPPSRWQQRPRRPHPTRNPPPNRPIAALPATPGRCCWPASTKFSRSCVPPVAARCASSPSSPPPPPCATSSFDRDIPLQRTAHGLASPWIRVQATSEWFGPQDPAPKRRKAPRGSRLRHRPGSGICRSLRRPSSPAGPCRGSAP